MDLEFISVVFLSARLRRELTEKLTIIGSELPHMPEPVGVGYICDLLTGTHLAHEFPPDLVEFPIEEILLRWH